MNLHIFWFALLGLMLTAYAVLDGFDLGVGMVLNLLARSPKERRAMLETIAPLWDGNEVWLVCFGGAFFGAFPDAYGAAFSGFYLPFMILLASLLLRAVAMELRDQESWTWWRRMWDLLLGLACLATAAIFGLMVADSLVGVPLGPHHEFAGTLADLATPLAGLLAFKVVVLFSLHGTLYLRLRLAPGSLLERVTRASWLLWILYLVAFAVLFLYVRENVPWTYQSSLHQALATAALVLKLVCMLGLGLALARSRPIVAFLLSAGNIACMGLTYANVLFPNLVASATDPALNLTIYNASSTDGTLRNMAWVALLGLPLALGYTGTIFWVFRARVRPEPENEPC